MVSFLSLGQSVEQDNRRIYLVQKVVNHTTVQGSVNAVACMSGHNYKVHCFLLRHLENAVSGLANLHGGLEVPISQPPGRDIAQILFGGMLIPFCMPIGQLLGLIELWSRRRERCFRQYLGLHDLDQDDLADPSDTGCRHEGDCCLGEGGAVKSEEDPREWPWGQRIRPSASLREEQRTDGSLQHRLRH